MSESRTVGELRELASRVLPVVELREVAAATIIFNAPPRAVPAPFDTDITLHVKAERSDAGELQSWSRYTATCLTSGDRDVSEAWRSTIEYVALFDINDPDIDFDSNEMSAFALLVGAPAVHPFARDLLQSLTGRSAFPAFTLGLMQSIAGLPEDHAIQLVSDGDEPPRQEPTGGEERATR